LKSSATPRQTVNRLRRTENSRVIPEHRRSQDSAGLAVAPPKLGQRDECHHESEHGQPVGLGREGHDRNAQADDERRRPPVTSGYIPEEPTHERTLVLWRHAERRARDDLTVIGDSFQNSGAAEPKPPGCHRLCSSCAVVRGMTTLALVAITSAVFCACGSGGAQQLAPHHRLIVLDDSIGGVRLNEPRRSVEKQLGRGTLKGRGLVSYFGGRLVVGYVFHDELTSRVEAVYTRWSGFHTRSGIRVGSSREQLLDLHLTCSNGICGRAASQMPDAQGTAFTMRHGRVVEIVVSYG
jgi:hypothetical protein